MAGHPALAATQHVGDPLARRDAACRHIEVGEDDILVRQSGPERLTLHVDAGLLHSAIENVVRNAVRFTPQGSVVEVTLAQDAGSIRIMVEDAGPGVPEAALPQLFEPFFQVDESRPHGDGGSGVGLAIARRAVQLHQGSIHAENRAGGGLRVTIELPLGGPDAPARTARSSAADRS